jgi:hypothetical protein
MEENKFTYGEEVQICSDAPECYRPGEFGAVCGFYYVKENEIEINSKIIPHCFVYTIEFDDGADAQIPEQYLLKSDE